MNEPENVTAQQTLLTLAMEAGDRSRIEIDKRLREMTADERRQLRAAIERLDGALDEIVIELRLEPLNKKDGADK